MICYSTAQLPFDSKIDTLNFTSNQELMFNQKQYNMKSVNQDKCFKSYKMIVVVLLLPDHRSADWIKM